METMLNIILGIMYLLFYTVTFLIDYWWTIPLAAVLYIVLSAISKKDGFIKKNTSSTYKTGSKAVQNLSSFTTVETQEEREAHEHLMEEKRLRQRSILATVGNMEGHEFEHFCADVLRHNGYDCRVTQGSGDSGADIIALKEGLSYAIQCKCYAGSVGYKAVQEAYSGKGIYDTDFAVALTNSNFTKPAIDGARKLNVMLWGNQTFLELTEAALEDFNNFNDDVDSNKHATDENFDEDIEGDENG